MKVELIAYTQEAEKIITAAGKLCYSGADIDNMMAGIDEGAQNYFVDMLISLGHESAIEHASYTFAIEGVSRALLSQITRHRIASFSVQSQRYVDMGDFEYIVPPAIRENPEALKEFEELIGMAREKYNKISRLIRKDGGAQAKKLANEDARFVLPMACETKIIMSMNARALYNFFRLRTCDRAQWEIKALAEAMLEKLKEVSPVLFKKAGPPCVYAGRCPEGKMSCGKPRKS